ncbi:hypothetical protein ID866_2391 [Astraeus odoratus]|nr:hypothetical protein ID866_2391 [Astraeus odoratus]
MDDAGLSASISTWPTRWQEAWDAAQPMLSSVRDSLSIGDAPNLRPLRVNQLDSELLDHQLVQLLCEPLQKALVTANMSLVPAKSKVTREVSYEFMNRQMVWHAFTEFLLFLLPLVSAKTLQRRIMRAAARLTPAVFPSSDNGKSRQRRRGKFESLPVDQCAICAENASYTLNLGYSSGALTSPTPYALNQEGTSQPTSEDGIPMFPIYIPYVTSCGHIYCYYCISERMMRTADEGTEIGWECLRCAEHVRSADRLEVEVSVTRDSTSDSDYEFSSEFGNTDLSGSVSSYLGSLTE